MSKFKDTRGVWTTNLVFKDRCGGNEEYVIFESVDEARKRFVELEDPTGIIFSDKYLGGYEHWKALKASKSLEEDIESWEEELEVRIRSKALLGIKTMSLDSFQAAKFLVDKGWDKKAGRPSKQQVEKETRIQGSMKLAYSKDSNRIKR